MNDARRRRFVIQKRAVESRLKRLEDLSKKECQHGEIYNGLGCDKCHPVRGVQRRVYRAYVYLKEINFESDVPHHIPVDLPVTEINQKIREMHMYGFWTNYYGKGAVFIPPREIRRIIIWMEDNTFEGWSTDKINVSDI